MTKSRIVRSGYGPVCFSAISTTTGLSLSSATTFFGASFVAPTSSPLAKFRIYMGTNTGSPTDIRASLYTDVSGLPNPAGAIASTETSAVSVTANAFNEFVFDANYTALTTGQRYWVVLTNHTGTPASNYPSVRHADTAPLFGADSTNPSWGLSKASTTSGNSGWGTTQVRNSCCAFELLDGTKAGHPAVPTVHPLTTSTSYEAGVLLHSPNSYLAVGGFSLLALRSSADGDLIGKLYVNNCLVATSSAIPYGNIHTSSFYFYNLLFPRTVIIPPNSAVRAVITKASGSVGHYRFRKYNWSSQDVDMLNSFTVCATSDSGSTWTDTLTDMADIVLLLDPNDPFPSPPINRRTSTGR